MNFLLRIQIAETKDRNSRTVDKWNDEAMAVSQGYNICDRRYVSTQSTICMASTTAYCMALHSNPALQSLSVILQDFALRKIFKDSSIPMRIRSDCVIQMHLLVYIFTKLRCQVVAQGQGAGSNDGRGHSEFLYI